MKYKILSDSKVRKCLIVVVKNHVNAVVPFWAFIKRRAVKFKGLKGVKFILHLKELKFGWDYKSQYLNPIICNIFTLKDTGWPPS